MKQISIVFVLYIGSIFFMISPANADGCYICQGQPGTYVRFTGSDDFAKRKKAEACGCRVGGTTSTCNAANLKILCEVSQANGPFDHLFSLNR